MAHDSIPVMDYEGSTWRTEFWRGREYEDTVERIALSKVLPPRGGRLAEIGAGFGRLADLYRGYERVILLDYARSMLKDAQARLGADPKFVFVVGDIYNLPFAESALDTALTIRVLHHIADIPRAFAECARSVRPGGAYLTDFANKKHLKAIAKYYLRRGADMNPFTLEPYEFVKLNFDYHPEYIRQNLTRAGFSVQQSLAVSTFRVGALKRYLPASLLVSLDSAIQAPTAALAIAPTILYRASSIKPGALQHNPMLWRCTRCGAAIAETSDDRLDCPACRASFHKTEGIWDFKNAD
jgi:ubiquinone/menaquinone biosynthesis C-methylase UbiE